MYRHVTTLSRNRGDFLRDITAVGADGLPLVERGDFFNGVFALSALVGVDRHLVLLEPVNSERARHSAPVFSVKTLARNNQPLPD